MPTPPAPHEESALPLSSANIPGLSPASWAAASGVAKWVGEKAASGIVGAVAGELFSKVMDAIGMGGPDMKEVVEKLDKISDQLVQVQRSLDRLTAITEEILKQLGELKGFIEKSLKIKSLTDAIGRIEAAYTGASPQAFPAGNVTGHAISLRLLTEKLPRFAGMTPEKLEGYANDFAGQVVDIPVHIAAIHNVLVKADFGQESLLMHWAKEFAQQVKAGKLEVEAAYLLIEGYFLQAVSVQLKGVSVHCVALGTDREFGAQLIADFLQNTFAKTMASETGAFVEAVELIVFSSLTPSMASGFGDGLGARDFPKHVDELLLRADLLCAALNLVGHKADSAGQLSPSIQAAIQGIYGRTVVRPSDLTQGIPPRLAPKGYGLVDGTAVRTIPFACLDLVEDNGVAVLRDVGASTASIAHYFWSFPSPAPAVDTPIDPSLRGGVTPGHYPVFGADQPLVVAAGLFDVSRLYQGLPPAAAQRYTYTPFPGGNNDLILSDEKCTSQRHPLVNAKGDVYESFFTVANIYRANNVQHSYVDYPLFRYAGAPAKVRLTAHVTTALFVGKRLDGDEGIARKQDRNVTHYLKVQRRSPDRWEKVFYNSVRDFGPDALVSMNGLTGYSAFWRDMRVQQDGVFSADFDLAAGDYELVLDSEAYAFETDHRYEGWQFASLRFFLRGLSLERR